MRCRVFRFQCGRASPIHSTVRRLQATARVLASRLGELSSSAASVDASSPRCALHHLRVDAVLHVDPAVPLQVRHEAVRHVAVDTTAAVQSHHQLLQHLRVDTDGPRWRREVLARQPVGATHDLNGLRHAHHHHNHHHHNHNHNHNHHNNYHQSHHNHNHHHNHDSIPEGGVDSKGQRICKAKYINRAKGQQVLRRERHKESTTGTSG